MGISQALHAVVLAGVALWLALDNPTISHTSRGDGYTCLALWDTVLNDADNYPGREPPPDGDQIAERCRDAGEERFELAAVFAVAAGAVAYRRERRPTT